MAYLLVTQVELLEPLTILKALQAANSVVLKVELAQLGALFEAVHQGDLIVVQVDLDEIRKAAEGTGHLSKEVVLEVDVEEVWALDGQETCVGILLIGMGNR